MILPEFTCVDLQPYVDAILDAKRLDTECAHSMCDGIVLEALRAVGCGVVADAFDEVENHKGGFWYA